MACLSSATCLMNFNLQDKYTQLAVRKSKFEEQMQQASQTLSGMEVCSMKLSPSTLIFLSIASSVSVHLVLITCSRRN